MYNLRYVQVGITIAEIPTGLNFVMVALITGQPQCVYVSSNSGHSLNFPVRDVDWKYSYSHVPFLSFKITSGSCMDREVLSRTPFSIN